MFKQIAEAYQCLSNPETRATYDLYGHNTSQSSGYRTQDHSVHSFQHADEIFRSFFGDADPFADIFRIFDNPLNQNYMTTGMGMSSRLGTKQSTNINTTIRNGIRVTRKETIVRRKKR